jgi:UDP-N-acetylmuramate dehydrogenase
MSLFAGLDEICRRDVLLADHTWFGVGGPARWLLEPTHERQLHTILRRCEDAKVGLKVLGGGSNVLVRDTGFDGAIVRLSGPQFEDIRFEGNEVWAGAAAPMSRLVRQSVRLGLGGLEAIAGIPGTIGGGLRMNAGGRFGHISTAVRRVRVMDQDGQIYERLREDVNFGYRSSDLTNRFLLGAQFELVETDPQELLQRFREIWLYKENTQPGSRGTAGCVFKNPPGAKAGQLIDQTGLKGRQVGGAVVSDRHANFIICRPGAKASDVEQLIDEIRDRVYARFGIELELEIEIW